LISSKNSDWLPIARVSPDGTVWAWKKETQDSLYEFAEDGNFEHKLIGFETSFPLWMIDIDKDGTPYLL
jgi:hypothetical protein